MTRPLHLERLDWPNRGKATPAREAAHRWLAGAGLGLWLALFAVCCGAGCGRSAPSFTPAPRSPETLDRVQLDAALWAARDPENRFWAPVAATHSMEPVINEHSLVLCLRYRGQPFANGAVLVYDRGDNPRVLHVVADQTADAVYMSGYNNHDSDGWFPKASISGIVVGQLNTP